PHALAREVLSGRDRIGRDFVPVALELLGDELAEAGERALPHLGACDADHRGVVRFDDDPGIDLGFGALCLGGVDAERHAQAESEPAAHGGGDDEIAPGNAGGCGDRVRHGGPPQPWRRLLWSAGADALLWPAARCTAARMRW